MSQLNLLTFRVVTYIPFNGNIINHPRQHVQANDKEIWDKEQPCQRPLSLLKKPANSPFTWTENEAVEIKRLIQWINLVGKFRALRVLSKKLHWTYSNALEIFIFIAQRADTESLWYFFTNSVARRTFSINNLSLIKAYWFWEIIPGKIDLRRFAKILNDFKCEPVACQTVVVSVFFSIFTSLNHWGLYGFTSLFFVVVEMNVKLYSNQKLVYNGSDFLLKF